MTDLLISRPDRLAGEATISADGPRIQYAYQKAHAEAISYLAFARTNPFGIQDAVLAAARKALAERPKDRPVRPLTPDMAEAINGLTRLQYRYVTRPPAS